MSLIGLFFVTDTKSFAVIGGFNFRDAFSGITYSCRSGSRCGRRKRGRYILCFAALSVFIEWTRLDQLAAGWKINLSPFFLPFFLFSSHDNNAVSSPRQEICCGLVLSITSKVQKSACL